MTEEEKQRQDYISRYNHLKKLLQDFIAEHTELQLVIDVRTVEEKVDISVTTVSGDPFIRRRYKFHGMNSNYYKAMARALEKFLFSLLSQAVISKSGNSRTSVSERVTLVDDL